MTSNSQRPMMVANWKMYKTLAEGETFMEQLKPLLDKVELGKTEVVVCPQFPLLYPLAQKIDSEGLRVCLGAQNASNYVEGAYTGEVSAKLLKELGVKYVVLGHSERREIFDETSELIREKIDTALEYGLIPIVCVGETLESREAGLTDDVITRQINAAISKLTPEVLQSIVIAYEPVWAIGTGKVCDPVEANRVITLIGDNCTRLGGLASMPRLLYGGSMKPENVNELMAQPAIDGGLVGGASLNAESFAQLVSACAGMPVVA